MDLSDFYSDSVTTPPWLHFRISSFIGVGHSILNCCVTFVPFLKKLIISFYLGFSQGLALCWIKVSEKSRSQQHSMFAQGDRIWFRVRRLNHSAMTAWRSFSFYLSVIVELLCGFYFLKVLRKYRFGRFRSVHKISTLDRKYPQWARLEPELDGPFGFLFRLRQHSAMTAFQNL